MNQSPGQVRTHEAPPLRLQHGRLTSQFPSSLQQTSPGRVNIRVEEPNRSGVREKVSLQVAHLLHQLVGALYQTPLSGDSQISLTLNPEKNQPPISLPHKPSHTEARQPQFSTCSAEPGDAEDTAHLWRGEGTGHRSNKLQREDFAFSCFIHGASACDFISRKGFAAKNNLKTIELDDL